MRRIPSLDGLRAISISMVLAAHFAREGFAPEFLGPYAGVGVRVFFVISGYLITALLLKEHDQTFSINLRRFYVRRAYRIFPAALFFMAIMFVVYWRNLRWYQMTAALLYVVNYFPRPWVLGHLWSLSVEEQFYLLWPSVLKKWHRHRVAILAGVFAFSPVYTAALHYFKWFNRLGMGTLPTVADSLAVGCLVAVFATRWPRIRKPIFAVLILVVIAIPMYDANTASRTVLLLICSEPDTECRARRNRDSRGAKSISNSESRAGGVARANQLQPVSVAATVYESGRAVTLWSSCCGCDGVCVLLPD
ncbi:MAG: acyltransferase [Candidatus Sulfotelmatobacter sp.]